MVDGIGADLLPRLAEGVVGNIIDPGAGGIGDNTRTALVVGMVIEKRIAAFHGDAGAAGKDVFAADAVDAFVEFVDTIQTKCQKMRVNTTKTI